MNGRRDEGAFQMSHVAGRPPSIGARSAECLPAKCFSWAI